MRIPTTSINSDGTLLLNSTTQCWHSTSSNPTCVMDLASWDRYLQGRYFGKVAERKVRMKTETFYLRVHSGKLGIRRTLYPASLEDMVAFIRLTKPGDCITLETPTGRYKLKLLSFELSETTGSNPSTETSPCPPRTSAETSTEQAYVLTQGKSGRSEVQLSMRLQRPNSDSRKD